MGTAHLYSAFTKTAPVVLVAHECDLISLDGTIAAAGYLQIFDSATAPSPGDVPKMSFDVTAAGPLPSIFASVDSIHFYKGLTVGISSTEATYTAVGTNYDVFGGVEGVEDFPPVGYSTAGDLTTGVESLQVWAAAAGPKVLYQFDATNLEVFDVYFLIFWVDSPLGRSNHVFKVASGETGHFYFGKDGLRPPKTTEVGCTIIESVPIGDDHTLLDTSGVSAGCNIRAYYI